RRLVTRGGDGDGVGGAAAAGWRDLDAVDLGVVLDGDELDGDRAGAACRGGERLGDRLELAAGGGEDVEVGQDLVAVDEDVEGPRAGGRPVLLGEVEADV